MKLHEGVVRYVDWKRANGYRFESAKLTLARFSKSVGEMDLSDASSQHILGFLNRTVVANNTWRNRYWTLYRFFEHWSDRGEIIALEMPTPKPAARRTFVPFIFTQQELRSLLDVISNKLNSRTRTDGQTLRALTLFLYATGVSIGEAVLVQLSDLDTTEGFVNIKSTRSNKSRRIPIGIDLQKVLDEYLDWRSKALYRNPFLFVTKRDRQVSSNAFAKSFGRIRRQVGIHRLDGSTYQPRVDDLRYTFAVHRITSWIEQGLDLNRMLPALAAYMGQVGLGSTERYLLLTPERYRKDLNKVSPSHGRGDWHKDSDLMKFLNDL